MNLFPEQISTAGQHQLDAHLSLLRNAAGSAFDSAEKMMALHFDATRATLEQSSALLRQLAAARDPRDLFALAGQGQSQLEHVLAYQRKLFGLASTLGSALTGLQPAVTPTATAALEKLAALPAVAAQKTVEQAAEVTVELVDSASAPLAEPEAPAAAPIAPPIAELTPVAAAAGHVEAHPVAAPVAAPADADVQVAAVKAPARPKKK